MAAPTKEEMFGSGQLTHSPKEEEEEGHGVYQFGAGRNHWYWLRSVVASPASLREAADRRSSSSRIKRGRKVSVVGMRR